MGTGRPGIASSSSTGTGLLAARSTTLAIVRVLFTCLSTVSAAPLGLGIFKAGHDEEPTAEGADKLVLLAVSMALVLLGGAFAGLTIALMGQDGIYLQVLARDYTDPQQRNAKRVYKLLKRGKHWVLVTLLLSNVIVNESLPVVLDRCLGGGVAAVVGSTVLIVIFGEIIPQSLCVRYGLQIGGFMAKPVLFLMYSTAPLSWPTAKLLDKLLGEDHGTVYKKSGLKTLVTLHKTLGDVSERLNQDEVTIISAVLDLKGKPVENVMTPMNDVFTMSEDTVLDEPTMDVILSAGYSRIPIHEAGNPTNFVGMLLVKILITYDPEDCKLVRDFPLATLPETRPETSCLDIVNFFQEGKSHMVLVSEYPGEDHGALGVVTLEDVIEELIGEEIIDESDVYIDVHKAIRRLAPAPKAKVQRKHAEDHAGKTSEDSAIVNDHDHITETALSESSRPSGAKAELTSAYGSSPKATTFMMRRSSSGVGGEAFTAVPVRKTFTEMREHLKHLGPSNPATKPKETKSTTIKIKTGPRANTLVHDALWGASDQSNETTALLGAQPSGKEGKQVVRKSYGSVNPEVELSGNFDGNSPTILEISTAPEQRTTDGTPVSVKSSSVYIAPEDTSDEDNLLRGEHRTIIKKAYVRSGSITENVIETKGVRKVVLETSSNDEEDSAAIASSPDQGKPRSTGSLTLLAEAATDESETGEVTGAAATTGQAASQSKAAGPSSGGSSSSRKKQRRKKRKN